MASCLPGTDLQSRWPHDNVKTSGASLLPASWRRCVDGPSQARHSHQVSPVSRAKTCRAAGGGSGYYAQLLFLFLLFSNNTCNSLAASHFSFVSFNLDWWFLRRALMFLEWRDKSLTPLCWDFIFHTRCYQVSFRVDTVLDGFGFEDLMDWVVFWRSGRRSRHSDDGAAAPKHLAPPLLGQLCPQTRTTAAPLPGREERSTTFGDSAVGEGLFFAVWHFIFWCYGSCQLEGVLFSSLDPWGAVYELTKMKKCDLWFDYFSFLWSFLNTGHSRVNFIRRQRRLSAKYYIYSVRQQYASRRSTWWFLFIQPVHFSQHLTSMLPR